jgi:tRNA pseudouridine38-40 synthase
MRTFKLMLSYDGTNYAGWQSQVDQPTVQGALEAVLLRITGEPVRTTASGRTDAGVHALAQVVSFQSETHLSEEVLLRAIRAYLPTDVAAASLELAADNFHAIRSAVRKRYRYLLAEGPEHSVFRRHYEWAYPSELDVSAMTEAAALLVGEHDFASFASSGSERKSSVRTIYELSVVRDGKQVRIEVEANGFLYNMVRNIVGTLVEVGRGAQRPEWVAGVLSKQDRRAAGPTAPPQGLCLVRVDY